MPAMTPAPIDPSGILAALRAHGESVMLPAAAYISDEVFAWERRHIFAGSWTCLGRAEEIVRADATHWAVEVGDVGVLLTVVDGTPRAFANVCRHRGHELLPTGGSAGHRAVVCPYHGWSFTLDGTLRAAPGMEGRPDDANLVELPLRVWHGWIFVNATGTAPSFDRYVGALDGIVAPYAPASLVVGATHTYDIAANWKIIVENYHECYHCPLIHPELCQVSPPNSGANYDLPGAWIGGEMALREHAETMSLSGLFPNLLVSAHPDYVMTHRLTPLSPGRTRVECSWLFPAGVDTTAYAVDFWDVTNREDWGACESVQRGVSNPHFRPGPLAAKEDAVYQWVTLLGQVYLDPAGAITAAAS
jgi:Rieske 2Fe-2S family protein